MSHQHQTKSIMEGELISSYLYEESLITEATIEEITSNISESTNSRSHFRPSTCICITCIGGSLHGKQGCKAGANGQCSGECHPTALPRRSASATELISRDFIE